MSPRSCRSSRAGGGAGLDSRTVGRGADRGDHSGSFRRALRDLPSTCTLGVIPTLLRRLDECGRLADLEAYWTEVCEAGPLFHSGQATCGLDQDCHRAALEAELLQFTERVPEPSWLGGLAPLADDGAEWPAIVQALGLGGLPLLHFGMDLDPAIEHDDPRGKEVYPSNPRILTQAWRASSTTTLAPPGDPEGFLAIFPGDDWPGFNHGGCANLFLVECKRLCQGSGNYYSDGSIQALDVLVHRAIAHRSAFGPDSWDFYLPDPGAIDYVSGCVRDDGVWSGDDCQAERLQAWIEGLDARFVANGLATWVRPSDLVGP